MLKTLIVLFAIALIVSCKSQEAQNGTKEDVDEKREISYNVRPEIVTGAFQPEQQQLNFQIAKAEIVNSDLSVSVKYGGGCKEHKFKLVYSQGAANDTFIFHLLHLTTDDRCRAYVFNDMQFDLSGILGSASLVLVNGQAANRK